MDQPRPALHLRLTRALCDTESQVDFVIFWMKVILLFVTDYAGVVFHVARSS